MQKNIQLNNLHNFSFATELRSACEKGVRAWGKALTPQASAKLQNIAGYVAALPHRRGGAYNSYATCFLVAMVWGFGTTAMPLGTTPVSAYPIYAQQGYENPREATGRIVCANCHLAQKPVEIEVPQAVLPNTVFEAVVKIPYDQQIQQVTGTGKKGPLNVGAVLILPEGFQLAPPDRISPELQARVGKLYIQPYSEKKPNILVVGPVPGKKYSEMTFPILSPDPGKTPVNGSAPVTYLNYPIYVGGNRGRGQVYPDGKKSNNNVFTSPVSGTVGALTPTTGNGEVGSAGMTIRIIPTASGATTADVFIPAGPSILVHTGDTVTADQPLTENPNVGGFGQEETSIVLQSEGRITGLLVFFAAVCIAQVFLVVKKKQYERVQLSEMNF